MVDDGWRIVFLTRLCPLFPFFLMNYAYGLTRVSLRHYVLATFHWLGLEGVYLITAVLSVVYITKVARRALTKEIGPPESKSTNADH